MADSSPGIRAPTSTAEFGHKLVEPFYRAASTHSRMNRIAARADALILRLKIKAAVKIESRTVFVELRAYAPAARNYEVDLFGP